ncbi:MAG: thiamine phosphate synthase [Bacteroidota bacterium]
MLIADRFTETARADAAADAVRGGVRWVHLRDHAAAAEAFEQGARSLAARLQAVASDVRISVNTRVEVAQHLGLGVHVGTRGPSVTEAQAKRPGAIVGYSAHTVAEAQHAESDGAAYVFFSPVFPTTSKPGHSGVGLAALRAVCAAVAVPVYALGGLTPATAAACFEAGAYGIAVLSGMLDAADPSAAARSYLLALP